MQAIEFETIAHGHTIRIPDTVPDGVRLQVRLLLDEDAAVAEEGDLKTLLANLEGAFPVAENVKNHPPQSIKQLKGIAPKPERVVSLEEMDDAIQALVKFVSHPTRRHGPLTLIMKQAMLIFQIILSLALTKKPGVSFHIYV